jgi:L,D-peptidoglycan transpeptidase YkuD (ErfK/YbiS/YcfS/YnhG family)
MDVWSDDPTHDGYNQMSRCLHPWFGHERMRRGDVLYDVVLFSDWNTVPAKPGMGSAIFIHCWKGARRPTAGCIAFARSDLLWIMARWRTGAGVIVQTWP